VIDAVVAQQGFDDELTYEQALETLVRLTAASHPQQARAEHHAVACYVLDTLQ